MGYVNDKIDKNMITNCFKILKLNMEMYKNFYIGLTNNNSDEGYNIINKKLVKTTTGNDYGIIIKNVTVEI